MKHVLYKTGDIDAPNCIKDRNNEVVLDLCKICGKTESQLTSDNCDKIPTAEQLLENTAFANDGNICELLTKFAKLHVQAALKAASNSAEIGTIAYSDFNYTQSELESKLGMSDWTYGQRSKNHNELSEVSVAIIKQDSILNSYPLENIK